MIDTQASERFMAAPWLGEIDPETKRAILNALVEARAPSGAILLAQDQPNDHLSFLIEGTASIERILGEWNGARSSPCLQAPAVFGSTSFFRPQPRASRFGRLRTSGCCPCIIPPTRHCGRPTRERPKSLALAVLRAVSERFDMMDKYIVDFLARHSERAGKDQANGRGFRARMFEE